MARTLINSAMKNGISRSRQHGWVNQFRDRTDIPWNQTGDRNRLLLVCAENMGKRRGPAGGALNRREMNLANICALVETKDCASLVECNVLAHSDDVLVESTTNKVKVGKDEGISVLETDSDDVLGVG